MTTWSPSGSPAGAAPNIAQPFGMGNINGTPGLGLTQGGSDYNSKYATYLKAFSGEMFKAYQTALIAKGTIQSRVLKNARSSQFIFTGRMSAEYHQPGEPILGNEAMPVAEKLIIMDDLLVSSSFVYDLDETLSHYSLRSEIAKKIGYALAEAYDKKVFRTIAKSAREAHPIEAKTAGTNQKAQVAEPGGSIIKIGGGNEYSAQHLVDAFFEAASILDEKNMPQAGRTAVLSPRQYYALVSQVDTNILNRDFGASQGNLNSGEGLYEIAGITIRRSNNLPFQAGSVSRVDGENNDYSGDFSDHAGLIYYKDAAATVTAIGPQIQTTGADVKALYQGDLIIGRLAMGCGTLNPAAAIEIQSA